MPNESIAYFSTEIALPSMPSYSGGLGVLAGDILREAADRGVTVVGVTLDYHNGYFKQKINDGQQEAQPDNWDPSAAKVRKLDTEIRMRLEGKDVNVFGLEYHLNGRRGVVPVNFLDTGDDICGWLYSNGKGEEDPYENQRRHRLKQEVVLGMGGVRFLDEMGYFPEKYHLNEGHSAFGGVQVARKYNWNVEEAKKRIVFTTHTLVDAGHERFKKDLVRDVLKDDPEAVEFIERFGGEGDSINMTKLSMNLSGAINAVSKRNKNAAEEMFPGVKIGYIDNAVHLPTWTTEPFRNLYDKHLKGWQDNTSVFNKAALLPSDDVWKAHYENKKVLVDVVKEKTGICLDPNKLTFGFARRMTGYKRPTLPFTDDKKLVEISGGKVQMIYAGKAHIRDGSGKASIKMIYDESKKIRGDIPIAYLENYDMNLGRILTAGVDVWLNTPKPPLEASGTSGMKASLNGVPPFTTIDGYFCDIFPKRDGEVGWCFGQEGQSDWQDAQDFYQKLEKTIIPKFYGDREGWIKVQKGTISLSSDYNTARLVRQHLAGPWRVNATNPIDLYQEIDNVGFC